MTHTKKICIIVYIFCLMAGYNNQAIAQITIGTPVINSTTVGLKWNPTNATQWRLGNKGYYNIERKTTYRAGVKLPTPEFFTDRVSYEPKSSAFWNPYKSVDTTNASTPAAYYATLYNILFVVAQTTDAVKEDKLWKRVERIASLGTEYAQKAGLAYTDLKIEPIAIYEYSISLSEDKTVTASITVRGQKADENGSSDRKMSISYISGQNLIQMRWNTPDAINWLTGVTSGYTIVRKEISSDGVQNTTPPTTTVTVKSEPQNSAFWNPYKTLDEKTLSTKDSTYYYILLYKSLYGSYSTGTGITADSRWAKVTEAASYSYRIAMKSGLGYQDATVADNKKYSYTITQTSSNTLDPVTFNTGGAGMDPNTTTPNVYATKLGVLAEAKQPGVIKVRWVSPSPEAWRSGNQNGYTVERKTTHRNGVLLGTPEVTSFNVFKELQTSSFWTPYINLPYSGNNTEADYLSVMYNTLYVTPTTNTPNTEQMIWFGVMNMANMSFKTASKGGLGYTDATAKMNERYTYTVSIKGGYPISSGFDTLAYGSRIYPKPKKPRIEFKEILPKKKETDKYPQRIAQISWDIDTLKNVYHSYWVQRATNSGTFKNLRVKPFQNLQKGVKTLTYMDTVEHSRVTYKYRLKGLTYFDTYDSSAVVEAINKVPLELSPSIDSVEIIKPKSAKIYWRFPSSVNNPQQDTLITGFILQRSKYADSLFVKDITVGSSGTILKSNRNVTINNINEAEYIRIGALGVSGDTLFSYSTFIQLPDDGPPSPPKNVRVSFTNGQPKRPYIQWDANTEPDLAGYKIYRKFEDRVDTIQITSKIIAALAYEDKDTLDIDFSAISYFVQAIDKKGNQSAFSLPAKLVFPDTKAPTPPVFGQYGIKDKGIELNWTNSKRDTDLAKNTLFRKDTPTASWTIVKDFLPTELTFIDKNVEYGKTYVYMLIAEDKTGLKSLPSVPLEVGMAKSAPIPPFIVFNSSVRLERKVIELNWSYSATDLSGYEIYRAVGTEKLTSWLLFSEANQATIDEKIDYKQLYKYSIRAVFKDGSYSNWKDINVTFPDVCDTGEFTIERTQMVNLGGKKVVDRACEMIILQPGTTIPKPTSASEEYEAVIKK